MKYIKKYNCGSVMRISYEETGLPEIETNRNINSPVYEKTKEIIDKEENTFKGHKITKSIICLLENLNFKS